MPDELVRHRSQPSLAHTAQHAAQHATWCRPSLETLERIKKAVGSRKGTRCMNTLVDSWQEIIDTSKDILLHTEHIQSQY